ncbi:MAG: FG-GAP-like repeat-containing protein [Acidobacteriaceae bacterium]
MGALSGLASAQVTCTNNSPAASQITCTGGPGASVTDKDDFALPVNTGLTNPVDGSALTIAPTVAGSPFPTSITISGAPAGVTLQNVSVTLHGYVSVGGTAVDAAGTPSSGSMAIGLLLTGPKSGGGTTNLELLRCVGGTDSSGNAYVQNGSFTLVNPGAAGALSIADGTGCGGVTYFNATEIGPAGAWAPSGGTYAIADYGTFEDVETEPNYNSLTALAGMIGSNLMTLSIPGSGLNVPTLVGGSTTGPGDFFPKSTTVPASNFGVFTGAQVDGQTWNLYLVSDDSFYTSVSFASWDITITYSGATTPSTTTLSPNPTGPFATAPNNTTTLTATVTSGATGTVTFKEGTNGLVCAGGNPATLSGGQATCTITYGGNSSEGYHSYTASYSGDGTYESSSGSAGVFVYNHATSSGTTYCNENGIAADGNNPTAPYPSVIYVGDGTSGSPSIGNAVETVSLELQSLSSGNTNNMEMLLVAPDGTHAFEFWGFNGVGATSSTGTYTIEDGGPMMPSAFVGPALTPGTYGPSVYDTFSELLADNPAPSPQIPGSFGIAPTQGSATFESSFTGATADGPWSLFLANAAGTLNTTLSGWCIDISPATGSATTVSVTSNPATYATKGSPITFTATVTSTGTVNEGIVAFSVANKVTGAVTSLGSVPVSDGTASASSSALAEGDQTVTAAYTDSGGSFNDNNGTKNFRVDAATATPTLSGTTWSYCNTAGITIPGGQGINDIGPAEPNPSNVAVSGLPGTVAAASVTLKNLDLEVPGDIATLLVGPNGVSAPATRQTLDFFSPITSTDSSYVQPVNQTVTFVDGAATIPATLSSNYSLGSQVGPTSNGVSSYTASSFYTLPTTVQHATDEGGFTFSTGTYESGTSGGVYQGTDGNGIWSLYFNQNTHEGALNPATWCMNLTYTPPSATVVLSHDGDGPSGNFRQAEQDAPITVSIENDGPGATGDPTGGSNPMTVTDTLPAGLIYSSYSGTGWTCSPSNQTVTCTNDSSVPQDSSYPELTIDVFVDTTVLTTSVSNSVTVSGAGVASTSSNSDTIPITPGTELSLTKSNAPNFTQGSTNTWTLTLANGVSGGATYEPITVTDSLPSGYTLANSISSNGSCSSSSAGNVVTVTCTPSTALQPGASMTMQLVVNIPANSPTTVENTATWSGGGASITGTTTGSSNTNTVTVVQVPASVSIVSGSNQNATANTAFTTPLTVLVKDAAGVTIPNQSVTFTAPGSGASGTFSNGTNTIIASTSGAGTVSEAFTANGNTGGPYSVTATAGSVSASPAFSLTNAIGTCTTANPNPNPNPASFAAVGDFNDDCRSDILWHNSSTEQVYEWLMNGTTFTGSGSPGSLTSGWVIQDVGDFDGDAKSDILWRNSTTGEVDIWLMNGTTMTSSTSLGNVSSDWSIAGVGDFNGDGYADILWQNTSGELYLWLMNGTTIAGGGIVGNASGWNVAGIGDFNGDGKADILWRNSTTGQVYVWLMNGTTITSMGSPGTPSSDWVIAGVGDFDGNGTSDILWRNSTTGEAYLWFMNGITFPSSGSLGFVTSDWSIQGVGDYDGSGRAGILWRNSTTEQVYIWLMNGTTIGSTGSPGTPDATWQIAP